MNVELLADSSVYGSQVITLNRVIQLSEFSNSTDHKIVRPVASWLPDVPRNLSQPVNMHIALMRPLVDMRYST